MQFSAPFRVQQSQFYKFRKRLPISCFLFRIITSFVLLTFCLLTFKLTIDNLQPHMLRQTLNKEKATTTAAAAAAAAATTNTINTQKIKSIKKLLNEKVRIFCLVFTKTERHNYLAATVYRTWAKHCNRILFVSNGLNDEFDPLMLRNREKWAMVKVAFKFVYERYFNAADWFLKIEDDSFVVIENLRHLLYPYDTNKALYFGYPFKNAYNDTYMYGAAGYVLSKEALRRFVELALTKATLCRADQYGNEDEEMGNCLKNVNVRVVDSRTDNNLHRFMPMSPKEHILGFNATKHKWLQDKSVYAVNEQNFRLPKRPAVFGKVDKNMMYDMNFFIYEQRIHGKKIIQPVLPAKMHMD